MSELARLLEREPPRPWACGGKIPWNEPGFSERMLREHLSQVHDAASRRAERIDAHVAWIHARWLADGAKRVLDLGCGPGLYTERLARHGHRCVGVDFSPASVAYARRQAETLGLECRYLEADLRTADPGTGFDLALLVFGELNAFPPEEAREILHRARSSLVAGGALLLEVHDPAYVHRIGRAEPSWSTAASGLFSDAPHLRLEECAWDEDEQASVERYLVVDLASGMVSEYASTLQAYPDDALRDMLREAGFADVEPFPSLTGEAAAPHDGLHVLAAA